MKGEDMKCTKCGGYNFYVRCMSCNPELSTPRLMEECPERFKLLKHNSDDQMNFGSCEDTKEYLEEGKTYNGKKEVHSCHTKIFINGHCFNSVCFEEISLPKNWWHYVAEQVDNFDHKDIDKNRCVKNIIKHIEDVFGTGKKPSVREEGGKK